MKIREIMEAFASMNIEKGRRKQSINKNLEGELENQGFNVEREKQREVPMVLGFNNTDGRFYVDDLIVYGDGCENCGYTRTSQELPVYFTKEGVNIFEHKASLYWARFCAGCYDDLLEIDDFSLTHPEGKHDLPFASQEDIHPWVKKHHMLLTANGLPVGYINYEPRGDEEVELTMIYVDPMYRDLGFDRKLIERFSSVNWDRTIVTDARIKPVYYERFDFEIVAKEDDNITRMMRLPLFGPEENSR